MEERIENGTYVKVTGFITLDGLDDVFYEIEQISSKFDESGRDLAEFKSVYVRSTKDLGRLLAVDPEFTKFRDPAISFGKLKSSRDKFFVCANDIEYADGKFGYKFERPATFDELAEIVRAYNKALDEQEALNPASS